MNKAFYFLWTNLLISIMLSGCQLVEDLPLFNGSTQETVPHGILLEDDFSNVESGWDRFTNSLGQAEYVNGAYRILVNAEYYYFWSASGNDFSNIGIEVETEKIAGGDENLYGVICAVQDDGSFYAFLITSDGYYGIFEHNIKDGLTLLGDEIMLPSEFIQQGKAVNTLQAACYTNRLVFYINGNMVKSVSVPGVPRGDTGLFAGTLSTSSTDIIFDNYRVIAP